MLSRTFMLQFINVHNVLNFIKLRIHYFGCHCHRIGDSIKLIRFVLSCRHHPKLNICKVDLFDQFFGRI